MKNLFLLYLRILAKIQLAKIRPTVIGVGGASGKSSLCNFISTILKEKYRVLESKGKNSQTGIPLRILNLKRDGYTFFYWIKVFILALVSVLFNWKRFDIYVVEMGINGPNEPNNMTYLLKIVRPKIGVLTNIALEHSEYFDSLVKNDGVRESQILEAIAKQEGLILKSLPKNGLALINLDDNRIARIKTKAEQITVSSKKQNATFFIKKVESSIQAFKVTFIYNKEEYRIRIPNPLPYYYAHSFVFAVSIAARFGFNVTNATEILERNFSLPPGRFNIFKGIKDTIILDSSYNNSPSAIGEALRLLNKISGTRRKVAIIGDMRELGEVSSQEHKILGELLSETADFAILIGPQVSNFTAKVLSRKRFPFLNFPNFTSSKKTILDSVREKDIILVKGSQNTLFLERAVEMLLKDSRDREKLARRGEFWDKKRRETQ